MAGVQVRNVRKVYQRDKQQVSVLDGLTLDIAEGDFVGADGPLGQRQDHAAQPDRRHRSARPRATSSWATSKISGSERREARELALAQRRLHLPALQPDPGADRAAERGAAAAAGHDELRRSGGERAKTALELVGLGDRIEPLSPPALGRAGAARRDRARDRDRSDAAPGRRADRRSRSQVRRARSSTLLERLNQEFKKTIVMVTHDPHAAERAHRVLHLDKGVLSN